MKKALNEDLTQLFNGPPKEKKLENFFTLAFPVTAGFPLLSTKFSAFQTQLSKAKRKKTFGQAENYVQVAEEKRN